MRFWERVNYSKLNTGQKYRVMDNMRFIALCEWDGQNFVTNNKTIIKNVNFVA
jgi:hypothetical protein